MAETKNQIEFAICVRNDDYGASLEVRKVYRVLIDEAASREGLLRIVDESGDDYLYPAENFALISLPAELRERFLRAG